MRRRFRGWQVGLLVLALTGTAHAAEKTGSEARREAVDMPPSETPLPMRVLFFDPQGLLPRKTGLAIGTEVAAIFRAVGVEVEWREGGESFGEGEALEFPVILLPADPASNRPGGPAMGMVRRNQGAPYPMWAYLSGVKWSLGLDRRVDAPVTSVDLDEIARAVGRVIAHELVHIVVPGQPHTETGLMRHALSRRDLVGLRQPLERGCVAHFREALIALAAAPVSGQASALAATVVAGRH